MTTLTADQPRTYLQGDINDLPVIATDIIYQGAAVGDNGSGYARPLQAGDPFRGFAETQVDNASGSAGDKHVRVRTRGLIRLAISSLAITDVGKDVYASDDNTFTLTQGSNTRIGHVTAWMSTGVGVVAFEAAHGLVAELTDNSGGTPADTIAVIGGTYSQSEVANAIASLAAKINNVIRRLGN
ncbi:cytoplasmic protein [Azospirillum sp. ST 5-10]|uniref:cytoplasmic protein n=1 Tax=unclassified Azospirillum TaxID=2630922 RepID=UPI003F4A5ECC